MQGEITQGKQNQTALEDVLTALSDSTPLHCYFFSDCLRYGIGFLLSTSSIVFSCRATLPSQPKTNQESVLLATTFNSLLCSFGHLQSKSDPVLAPPSLFGGLTSPLSQSLDWKTCIQTCNKVYVLKKFIFQSQEDGAWPRYWKITAPNQTAMTLEETRKPLLCAKPNKNTPHFAHFVPGGCPSGKNAEFPHIDADKRQVLPPG